MSLLNNLALKCDYSGKNFYIFNEEDYVKFVELCNSTEFASSDIKTFHLMNNLNFNSVKRTDIIINEFKHILDGEGFEISGLNIGTQNDEITGLVKVNVGTIQNLTVSGEVYAYQYAGGICGKNFGGTILDCVNKCNINMPMTKVDDDFIYTYAGGICGELLCESTDHTEIFRCTNYGTISGYAGLGGICGRQHSGDIIDCLNLVMPQCSTIYYGGISGNYFTGRIITSVNSGLVDAAETNGGGIIGFIATSNMYYKVVKCYYKGRETDSNRGIGNATVTDSSTTVIKILPTEFCDKTKFSYLTFDSIWSMLSVYDSAVTTENDRPFLLSDGTYDGNINTDWFNPNIREYDISTPLQVIGLSTIIKTDAVKNKSLPYVFNQTQDINFNNKTFTHQIGKVTNPFKEIYNGNNFKLYNLKLNYISDETSEITSLRFTGLFGCNAGTIKDLVIKSFTSQPVLCSAALLVEDNEGNLINCYAAENSNVGSTLGATGILCGTNGRNGNIIHSFSLKNTLSNANADGAFTLSGMGGLCVINYGQIINSFAYNFINSIDDNVGGICADNFGTIDFCNNEPFSSEVIENLCTNVFPTTSTDYLNSLQYTISGVKNVGGLVGINYGTINNSNSKFSLISGLENVGGIVGLNYQYSLNSEIKYVGKISECVNNNVSISSEAYNDDAQNLGGIAGASYNSEILNCISYSDSTIHCKSNDSNIGGIVGSFSGSLKTSYNIAALPESYNAYCGSVIGYLENSNPFDTTNVMFFNIEDCYGKKVTKSDNNIIFTIGGNSSSAASYDIIGKTLSLTDAQLLLEESYDGFDFVNVWDIANESTPLIKSNLLRDSRNFVPKTENYQYLGLPDKKFKGLFAEEIYAKISTFNLYTPSGKNLIINGGCTDVTNPEDYLEDNTLFTPLGVNRGGTGANIFETPGYIKANSTVPFTTINKIPEDDLNISNVVTNNATVDKHGFLPKLDGSVNKVLKGDGTWGTIENLDVTANDALTSPTQMVNNLGLVASDITLEGNTANVHKFTVAGNIRIILTPNSNLNVYRSFYLLITNGGNYYVEWPNSIKWSGGIAPALTNNGTDVVVLNTVDAGVTWYGVTNGVNFS